MNRKVGKMALRGEVESHLAALLAVDRFKDYGPNGLQVEGRSEVLQPLPRRRDERADEGGLAQP